MTISNATVFKRAKARLDDDQRARSKEKLNLGQKQWAVIARNLPESKFKSFMGTQARMRVCCPCLPVWACQLPLCPRGVPRPSVCACSAQASRHPNPPAECFMLI